MRYPARTRRFLGALAAGQQWPSLCHEKLWLFFLELRPVHQQPVSTPNPELQLGLLFLIGEVEVEAHDCRASPSTCLDRISTTSDLTSRLVCNIFPSLSTFSFTECGFLWPPDPHDKTGLNHQIHFHQYHQTNSAIAEFARASFPPCQPFALWYPSAASGVQVERARPKIPTSCRQPG